MIHQGSSESKTDNFKVETEAAEPMSVEEKMPAEIPRTTSTNTTTTNNNTTNTTAAALP